MKAWHFLRSDKRLHGPDSRPVRSNVWYAAKGKIKLCVNGMHGSRKLIDALRYAPGPIVCHVEIDGDIIKGDDKIVGRRRCVLAMVDATDVLYEFACWCAEDALRAEEKAGRKVDQRSWAVIHARRQWLRGEIDDKQLGAASYAAAHATDRMETCVASSETCATNSAARTATCVADRAVAYAASTASYEASYEASYAAASAANSAARTASYEAAHAAARAKQNCYLTRAITRLLKSDSKNKGKF